MQSNASNDASARSNAIANRPPTPAPFTRPTAAPSVLLKRGIRGTEGTIGLYTAILNEMREVSSRMDSLANVVINTGNSVRDFKAAGETYFYDAAQNMAANFATFDKRNKDEWSQYRTVPPAILTLAKSLVELKEAQALEARKLSTLLERTSFLVTSVDALAGNIAESGATVTSDEFFDECRRLFEERFQDYAQARGVGIPSGIRAPDAPCAPPPTPTRGVEEIRAGPIPALLLAAALRRSTDPRPRPVLHAAMSAIRESAEDEETNEDAIMSGGSAGEQGGTLP
ncbi:hypothetical protein EXIGLDRAFT_823873 [Exidia glandulosa HHB12029]|uniref:Uncharacterized protein n=1 Tax=Exidia glandulosa HHB12029 TaxID=1314781 RepID=A0A165J6W0_EXIGL|nr:hypothetical protein EXIGLDRAFT_823873 [Exidia glandulosa HHB12029]